MSVRYSIVIPTMDRAATLLHSLQACLNMDYSDYEIVVGDNFSSDETAAVVNKFADAKIKYYRTDRRLSMTKNWELALTKTSGEWITYIGDDDAIFPYAFRQVDRLLDQVPTRLVCSQTAFYGWPDLPASAFANYLRIGLRKGISLVSGAEALRETLARQHGPGFLPSIYHGFVHRSLVDQMVKVTGKMFVGCNPDVYTAFVLSYLEKDYLRTEFPLTMVGHASKSNGGLVICTRKGTSQFIALCEADGLELHGWVPKKYLDPTGFYDPFMLAKERFFSTDGRFTVNRKDFLTQFSRWHVYDGAEEWQAAESALRQSLVGQNELRKWFDEFVNTALDKNPPPRPAIATPKGHGLVENALHLDAARFGVTNIVEAMEVCDKILCIRDNPVDYIPPAQGRLDRLGLPKPVKTVVRRALSVMRMRN